MTALARALVRKKRTVLQEGKSQSATLPFSKSAPVQLLRKGKPVAEVFRTAGVENRARIVSPRAALEKKQQYRGAGAGS